MCAIDIAPDAQGKVRDIYDLGDRLLIVATDRISAFDHILEDQIPYKGRVLTQLSCFWFELLEGTIENHLISTSTADLPARFKPYADYLRGRFMIVKKAEMFPLECVVRGYLTGSGLAEYKARGMVDGIKLPAGLVNGSRFEQPLFTPSTKAQIGNHDENIDFEGCKRLIGEKDACALRDKAIEIYHIAHDYAATRGVIIADTKFEFGQVDGKIILADEALTPDSSRFWLAESYREGQIQPSFDKQYVRDWLDAHWNRKGTPPRLPQEVIEHTSEKYILAYEVLTGRRFRR